MNLRLFRQKKPRAASTLTCVCLTVIILAIVLSSKEGFRILRFGSYNPIAISHRLRRVYAQLENNSTWLGRPLLRHSLHTHFWFGADVKHFSEGVESGGLNVTYLTTYPMEPHMTDWEWTMLNFSPLSHHLDAGNETTSKLLLIQTKPHYRVGDTLSVRIDVYNGRGQPMTTGGDDVRVRAVDKEKKASMATEVTDLNNGSYVSHLPLLWAGTLELHAYLAYNRHVIRASLFVRNALKTTKITMAGFSSQFSSEATMCSPFPKIPEHESLCNFTNENGGLPWYCGHPRSKALSCKHWNYTADLPFIKPLPFTPAEHLWFEWLNAHNTFGLIGEQGGISVRVEENNKGLEHVEISSNDGTANGTFHKVGLFITANSKEDRITATWSDISPHGHFLGEDWISRRYYLPTLSRENILKCFNNKTLLLLGDSNLRLLFRIFAENSGCVINTGTVKPKWHKPLVCTDNETNFEMRWRIHSMPFHCGSNKWGTNDDSKPISEYIDEIPNSGKFVVVIHIYLHFTPYHYSVYTIHVRNIRAAISRLLQRNPDVQVVMRSPHAAIKGWLKQYGGDMIGPLYMKILKREFEGLRNRVYLLETWDMTVAAKNENFHPDDYVNLNIAKVLFAQVCS